MTGCWRETDDDDIKKVVHRRCRGGGRSFRRKGDRGRWRAAKAWWNLVALVSDTHVNGLREEIPTHQYEETCFSKTVEKILALAPAAGDGQMVSLRI